MQKRLRASALPTPGRSASPGSFRAGRARSVVVGKAGAGMTLAVAPPVEDGVDLVVDAVAGRSAVNSCHQQLVVRGVLVAD